MDTRKAQLVVGLSLMVLSTPLAVRGAQQAEEQTAQESESSSEPALEGVSPSEGSSETDTSADPAPAERISVTPDGGTMTIDSLAERPDRYVIQRGDTLWDISARFWGDPFVWPRLWSFNPYIGNAHLIYPGNLLKFGSGNFVRPPSVSFEGQASSGTPAPSEVIEVTANSVEVRGEDVSCRPTVRFYEHTGSARARSLGMLREQAIVPLGSITKAPEQKLMFGSGDYVYMQLSRISDHQCGDIFTIYEMARRRVNHPIYHRRVIGSVYRIVARVQIVDMNEFVATGRLLETYSEVKRGQLLTEPIEVDRVVDFRPSDKEIEGFIVEGLNQEGRVMGTGDIVYIDRGQRDDVEEGDTFYVVRQGDGIEGFLGKGERDVTMPYHIVGRLIVSQIGEYVSEAIITESNEVIEVGDTIITQIN